MKLASTQWVCNLRLVKLCYAVRGHICKLCKNFPVIYEVGITHAVHFKGATRYLAKQY